MKKAIRPVIFKWRQPEPELILYAVRWHLRHSLSVRCGTNRLLLPPYHNVSGLIPPK